MRQNKQNPPHRRPWFHAAMLRVKRALGMPTFLCDSCRYDWRSACHRSERPNATWCPDYRRRG